MFSEQLAQDLKEIFGIEKVVFNDLEYGSAEDYIFCEIDKIADETKERRVKSTVYGKVSIAGPSAETAEYGCLTGKTGTLSKKFNGKYFFDKTEKPADFEVRDPRIGKYKLGFICFLEGGYNPAPALEDVRYSRVTPALPVPEIIQEAFLHFTASKGLIIENDVIKGWQNAAPSNILLSADASAAGNEPVFAEKGLNGRPAVMFGSVCAMTANPGFSFDTVPMTAVIVSGNGIKSSLSLAGTSTSPYKPFLTVSSRGAFSGTSTNPRLAGLEISRFTTVSRLYADSPGYPAVFSFHADSERNTFIRINGKQQSRGASADIGNIGSPITLTGESCAISEILYFRRQLNEEELISLEKYFASVYLLEI